jgi:hypothetical protein
VKWGCKVVGQMRIEKIYIILKSMTYISFHYIKFAGIVVQQFTENCIISFSVRLSDYYFFLWQKYVLLLCVN